MAEGLGSKNPFILRNYRFITPNNGRVFTINDNNKSFDIEFQFKVDGAPVILTYESDLILRLKMVPKNNSNMSATVNNATFGTLNALDGMTSLVPPYRLKLKSLGNAVKYCRINMSNSSFYSINTPQYLNENLLRKTTKYVLSRPDSYTTEACVLQNVNGNSKYYLAPAGTITKQWDNASFVSPTKTSANEYVLDFRIPLTDLLPVFKAGVLPIMLTNSRQFDFFTTIYGLAKWFVPFQFDFPTSLEPILSLTTVAFPEMNPLAELIIKPHLQNGYFRAPYLDYNVFSRDVVIPAESKSSFDFDFNVTQYYNNVPFVSLSFLDTSTPGDVDSVFTTPTDISTSLQNPWMNKITLTPEDREVGGFYTLPTGAVLENVNVKLGSGAIPLTQWPLDGNMTYLMNRKHFEMYGRRYNESRICPVSRSWQGDASFFFDLSHGGHGGFQIDSDNPLQVTGMINTAQAFVPSNVNIRVMLTVWFSNHLIVTEGGGVTMKQ